jgi:hypothetical protein
MASNPGKVSRFSNQEARPDDPLTPNSRVSAVGPGSAPDSRRGPCESRASELPLGPFESDDRVRHARRCYKDPSAAAEIIVAAALAALILLLARWFA